MRWTFEATLNLLEGPHMRTSESCHSAIDPTAHAVRLGGSGAMAIRVMATSIP